MSDFVTACSLLMRRWLRKQKVYAGTMTTEQCEKEAEDDRLEFEANPAKFEGSVTNNSLLVNLCDLSCGGASTTRSLQ